MLRPDDIENENLIFGIFHSFLHSVQREFSKIEYGMEIQHAKLPLEHSWIVWKRPELVLASRIESELQSYGSTRCDFTSLLCLVFFLLFSQFELIALLHCLWCANKSRNAIKWHSSIHFLIRSTNGKLYIVKLVRIVLLALNGTSHFEDNDKNFSSLMKTSTTTLLFQFIYIPCNHFTLLSI